MKPRAGLIFLVALLCTGCRTGAPEPPNVGLRFWNGFSGPDGATMKKIVERYNADHPESPFEMQIIPWSTYYDKVTLGMAFGGAPDVFVLQVSRLPQYADAGALQPIGPMVNKSGLSERDFVKTPYSSGFWKGVQYGLPLDCWPLTMYYNKRLFRAAGISHPPTNLEEFLADARRLTRRDASGNVTQWGFALSEIHNNLNCLMYQHGGNVIDPAGSHSTLSTPESAAAVDEAKSFVGSIAPDPQGANAWDTFKTGKAAMVFQGIYMVADLEAQKSLEFGAAPVPQLGPKRVTWAGSHMLCIPRGLSPERTANAWKFIRYLSDHSLSWAAAGQCPVRLAALRDPTFKTLTSQFQAARQLDYVQYEPQSPVIGQVGGFADSAWEAILMNGDPTASALATANRRINEVLARR